MDAHQLIEMDLQAQLNMGFSQAASIEDLNSAVNVADLALYFTPPNEPDYVHWLNILGDLHSRRFEKTRSAGDLNRAIELANMAVEAAPLGHPESIISFNSLAISLGRRFETTGSMGDLNRAIELADMTVDVTSQGHPYWTISLNSLAMLLNKRFERTGSLDDLSRAIELADVTVDTPQGHPDSIILLNNLTNMLGRRFERTGSMRDLDHAVEVADKAVDATSQGQPYWAISLKMLGNALGRRSKRTGSMDDLNRAVEVANKAVNAITQDQPDRAGWLNDLGILLNMRFERTKGIEDLNRAIEVADMAIEATPQDYPDRASLLSSLGDHLRRRYERSESEDDMERLLSSYKGGWGCSNAPPSDRIHSARIAAYILAGQSKWGESSRLLQGAVELLPSVSPRSIRHTDKQHELAEFAGLASMAAGAALNAGEEPYHALRSLEFGRDIISGLLMEMRGDISDLEQQHSGLANEFVSLRDQLDSPASGTRLSSSSTTSLETRTKQRHEADQKFSDLIKNIRSLHGFQNFLLPPTADELMAAADPDPIIVVNPSPFRCDAFLIECDRIRVLELPALKVQEIEKQIRGLRMSRLVAITPLLEWLWDTVCGPCLEALGFKKPLDNNWPRVWWVPTGLLSQLPLHAAGYHTQGSTKAVLDRVMSSYTSSIKALIQGRRNHFRQLDVPPPEHALLVAMRETPGLSTNRILPFVDSEVKMFHDLCPSLQLKPITPTPRKDDVLNYLATSRIFHFAGHGRSDPVEPSQSCLLLEDWQTNPLTVGDFRDHRLQKMPPFLGYLSACSTGANKADELLDEGIHLVSALQLAGFRHVVGTLWEVSDEHCVDVARVLYKTIQVEGLTDMAVCHGLHQAIRAVRNGQIEKREGDRTFTLAYLETQPRDHYWAPYVHFGV